ncbi:O-methyltransferase [Millisia brevis]|uniref:O-methyltransferase n=1 Tax=Millisia brevis TaxID=264148 RepID=UPI0008363695|nr:class I SAM-dependent methyltransferase [Millisia brevis]
MTTFAYGEPLTEVLTGLYRRAADQRSRRGPGPGRPSRGADGGDARERAVAAQDMYMPISPSTGVLAYSLVRAARPTTVVEFGMSYGISTLHLAAAVRDNGIGAIHTSELSDKKIAAASASFAEAGVADLITVHDGDALETLAAIEGPIGFLLLDGWKDLYVPVLRLLEDRLVPGSLILADNADHAGTAPYLEYVRDARNGYTGVYLDSDRIGAIELSCRI